MNAATTYNGGGGANAEDQPSQQDSAGYEFDYSGQEEFSREGQYQGDVEGNHAQQQQQQQQQRQDGIENTWLSSGSGQTSLQEQLIQRYQEAATMQQAAEIQQQAVMAHQREWYAQHGLEAHFAAATGDVKSIHYLARSRPRILNKQDEEGKTPLMYAVNNDHTDVVNALMQARVKLNLTDSSGNTALHYAVFREDVGTVRTLLSAGAKVGVRDSHGRSPLHHAMRCSTIKCAMELLKSPSKNTLNSKDTDHMTPIHWACYYRQPQHVAMLILRGAAEDVVDVDKKTPLHWAAQNGDPMCVSYLLESKSTALVNNRDSQGLMPLHLAATGGHHNVLKVLARASGIKMDLLDPQGRTSLHWAAAACQDKAVNALISFGAHPCKTDKMGQTPLAYALAHEAPPSLIGPLSDAVNAFHRNEYTLHAARKDLPSISPLVRRHRNTSLGKRLTRRFHKASTSLPQSQASAASSSLGAAQRSKTEPTQTRSHARQHTTTKPTAATAATAAMSASGDSNNDHERGEDGKSGRLRGQRGRSDHATGGGGSRSSYAAMRRTTRQRRSWEDATRTGPRSSNGGNRDRSARARRRSNDNNNNHNDSNNNHSRKSKSKSRGRNRSRSRSRRGGTRAAARSRGSSDAGRCDHASVGSGHDYGSRAPREKHNAGHSDGTHASGDGNSKGKVTSHLTPPSGVNIGDGHLMDTRRSRGGGTRAGEASARSSDGSGSGGGSEGASLARADVEALKAERDQAASEVEQLKTRVQELEEQQEDQSMYKRRVGTLETKLEVVMRQLAIAEREKESALAELKSSGKLKPSHAKQRHGVKLPAIQKGVEGHAQGQQKPHSKSRRAREINGAGYARRWQTRAPGSRDADGRGR